MKVVSIGLTLGFISSACNDETGLSTNGTSNTESSNPTPTPSPSPTPIPTPGDPFFSQQWYLINSGQNGFSNSGGLPGKDINYQSAIAQGFSGIGVRVLVSDDGVEVTHEDLVSNVDPIYSRDYSNSPSYIGNGNHLSSSDHHGTPVAGIIAATANNNIGIRGVAPGAKISSANFLSVNVTIQTLIDQANTEAEIVNQSWGKSQLNIYPISPTYRTQLSSSAAFGRGGKGTLFIKSAGNDFVTDSTGLYDWRHGNTNFDGNNSTPYTIMVGALGASDLPASYSSPGSNLWISAYGGENGDTAPAIVTTDRTGCNLGIAPTFGVSGPFDSNSSGNNPDCKYTSLMNGTSSAAPIMSGAVAMILQANPNLSWRDVKHIIASTATQVNPNSAPTQNTFIASPPGHTWEQGWIQNSSGYRFHNRFGFGKINLDAAVAMATTYSLNLGQMRATTYLNDGWIYDSGPLTINTPDYSAAGSTSQITVRHNYVIESVQIRLSVNHPDAGEIGIELTSPSGTKSILKNVNDALYQLSNINDAVFLSNAFYGEPSLGIWTLKILDGAPGNTGTLTNWKININGHKPDSILASPPDPPIGILHQATYKSLTSAPPFSFSPSPSNNVIRYEYSIGSTPGNHDILDWRSIELSTAVLSTNNLSLANNAIYFVNLKAIDSLENESSVASSAGWTALDPWIIISNNSAPQSYHTAVWTGSDLLIWGGLSGNSYINTGYRFNLANNSWSPMATAGAPSPRSQAKSVWTGTEMFIWGGYNMSGQSLANGGRYNPVTNSWLPVSTGPQNARDFSMIWTGTEVIIFSGSDGASNLNNIAKYNPASNSWTQLFYAQPFAPAPRMYHTAVWTGSKMLVWGGNNNNQNNGMMFDPTTNTWTPMSSVNAPSLGLRHTAVWTGSEMIVWGGHPSGPEGGRYNPSTNTWQRTTITNAPTGKFGHSAVWTGTEMIIFGGFNGPESEKCYRYDPIVDNWTRVNDVPNTIAPQFPSSFWTGSEMVIWGINGFGGRYSPY